MFVSRVAHCLALPGLELLPQPPETLGLSAAYHHTWPNNNFPQFCLAVYQRLSKDARSVVTEIHSVVAGLQSLDLSDAEGVSATCISHL